MGFLVSGRGVVCMIRGVELYTRMKVGSSIFKYILGLEVVRCINPRPHFPCQNIHGNIMGNHHRPATIIL